MRVALGQGESEELADEEDSALPERAWGALLEAQAVALPLALPESEAG